MRLPLAREALFSALGVGVAAGLICFVATQAGDLGSLLFILPFPLLMFLGLSFGAQVAAIGCVGAGVATAVLVGPAGGFVFACFVAVPVYYFIQQSLMWRGNPNAREWYPMLKVLSDITAIVAACLMFIAMMTGAHGGLKTLVASGIVIQLKANDPDIASVPDDAISMAFVALFAWLWVILIYASATLANAFLVWKHRALRPSLAIERQGMPGWLLLLLFICGLMASLGEGADRFTAETLFLLLLLPYFLCGLAFVHAYSVQRFIPLRRFWIACVYITILVFRWPALAVIAMGLYQQLSEILDRRKKMR